MKKLLLTLLCISALGLGAQPVAADDYTAKEEAEGKIVWEKLQEKTLDCADLSEDNFATLGEYFMGLMMGDAHATMNQMMIQMMGEDGEAQMHVVMGKRLSSCDQTANLAASYSGWMSMMGGGMMTNNYSTNSMMNFGLMSGGWLFMILFWVIVVVGLVALVKWLVQQGRGAVQTKTPLEVLKERYAKGEIDKKEFEEKKTDLI